MPYYFAGLCRYCEWSVDSQTGIIKGYLQFHKDMIPPSTRFSIVWRPSDVHHMGLTHFKTQHSFGDPEFPPITDLDLDKLTHYFTTTHLNDESSTAEIPPVYYYQL